MIIARAVGFGVSILQARLFNPTEFGEVQYAITIAGVLAIGTQPFGQHVLARYIGQHRNTPEILRVKLTNAGAILTFVFTGTLIIGTVILKLCNHLEPGIPLIYIGVTIFYAYWGIARGNQAYRQLAIADLANNITQIFLILLVIDYLRIHSTFAAMAIQGLACLLPLFVLQLIFPIQIHLSPTSINLKDSKKILQFSYPIWLSHGCHILFTSLPVIFLEYFRDKHAVGIFNLGITLSLIFSFVPTGIVTLLMPRIAGSSPEKSLKLLKNALVVSGLSNGALFLIYLWAGDWFIQQFFGSQYLPSRFVFITLGIIMILIGLHSLITAAFVGFGRPAEETISRLIGLFATTLSCWIFVPKIGGSGAALAQLIGICLSLAVYGWILFQRPLNLSTANME